MKKVSRTKRRMVQMAFDKMQNVLEATILDIMAKRHEFKDFDGTNQVIALLVVELISMRMGMYDKIHNTFPENVQKIMDKILDDTLGDVAKGSE